MPTVTTVFAESAEAGGVEVEQGFAARPDPEGVLTAYTLSIPHLDRACYFAAYQAYDMTGPHVDNWPEGANRVQPLVVEDFRSLKNGGLFLVAKTTDNTFLALLPIAGTQTLAWFCSDGDDLVLKVGNLGTGSVEGDVPVLAWAWGADPLSACRRVWELAIAHPLVAGSTRLRCEKHYPEVFRFLGWCSWEEYKKDISAGLLDDAMDGIEASGLPIRYVLVDDGHLSADKRKLTSFAPNEKFPDGWTTLMARRNAEKVRWLGLWLNFNGYWSGIHPDNDLGPLNDHLERVTGKAGSTALFPKGEHLDSVAMYDAMIGAARAAGFDFVKVDNQAGNLRHLWNGVEQAAERAGHNSQALEAACARHMDGLINCMAHNTVCAFNTRLSAVTRCSEDYKVGNAARAKRHLHNSYANIAWIGHTVWGDHDMFHSNDAASGRMMAVSKALSGAPVYLSDAPTDFTDEHVLPLCYADGELLRPLAPAAPLAESLFIDPFAESAAFRAIAPLPNGAAAIVLYNLTEPEQPVDAAVSADDYRQAPALMQPVEGWPVPDEGLFCYDWYGGTGHEMRRPHHVRMSGFSDRLFLLCPIQDGWAVIGRPDKYLSPGAVEVLRSSHDQLILRLIESGPLLLWLRKGIPVSDDASFRCLGDGLWQADLPVGERNTVIVVARHSGASQVGCS